MSLFSVLAAAAAVAVPPAPPLAPVGFARAAVEVQLAQRATRSRHTGISGAEATVMLQTHLTQLAGPRKADPVQNQPTAPGK